MARQGPHHAAQKSTMTGRSDLSTLASKSSSPTWIRFACASIFHILTFMQLFLSQNKIVVLPKSTLTCKEHRNRVSYSRVWLFGSLIPCRLRRLILFFVADLAAAGCQVCYKKTSSS